MLRITRSNQGRFETEGFFHVYVERRPPLSAMPIKDEPKILRAEQLSLIDMRHITKVVLTKEPLLQTQKRLAQLGAEVEFYCSEHFEVGCHDVCEGCGISFYQTEDEAQQALARLREHTPDTQLTVVFESGVFVIR